MKRFSSLAIWLGIAVAIAGLVPANGGRSSSSNHRSSSSRTQTHRTQAHAPNHDHVRLTHASPSHSQPHHSVQQQQHVQKAHVPQTHASAPALPPQTHVPAAPNANANSQVGWKADSAPKPIGWNVGGGQSGQMGHAAHPDSAVSKHTVSNTNSGFQQSHAPSAPVVPVAPPAPAAPYVPHNNAMAPPPNMNQPFQSSYPGQPAIGHPQQSYPAVQPQHVPYNPNPIPNGGYAPPPHQNFVPPPQQNFGHPSYPVQQPGYVPQGGNQPIINNYYHDQPKTGGGAGSALQTAAIAGIGGLALYGALKPSEQKTVIIHEGVSSAPPVAPAAAIPAAINQPPPSVEPSTAGVFVTPVAPNAVVPNVPVATLPQDQHQQQPMQPIVQSIHPLAPLSDQSTAVPLAPLPGQSVPVPLAPLPDDRIGVPLAPLPEQITSVPLAPLADQSTVAVQNVTVVAQTTPSATTVPIAITQVQTQSPKVDAAHSPLKSAATSFVIFNMSFYSCVSMVVAKLLLI